MAQKLQEASAGLAETVFPALNDLTHPDLKQQWFLDAYQVTWAMAMLLWLFILLWTLVQRSRRQISGDELAHTFTTYTPLFLAGCTFGPLVGAFLLKGVGLASDSLAAWAFGSVEETTTKLQGAIRAGDADQIAGGSVVAIVIFSALILALLLVLLMLLVMMVTLFLTGVVMPLGLAWITHPRRRSRGLRLLYVWAGVCGAHVLIFLMLGTAFHMVAGLTAAGGGPLQVLVNLAVAVLALILATFAPMGLLLFAPVGPTEGGATGGVGVSTPGGGSRSGWSGTDSPSDSQTAQLSREPDGGGGGDGADAASSGPGPLARHLQALQSGGPGAGGAESGDGDKSSTASMEAPAGGGAPALPGSGAGGGARAGGGGAAGAGAGGGEAAAGAASAGEAATAAGAATTATGVGAVAGVALIGAGMAISATADAAEQGAQLATEHMEHSDGGAQDARDESSRW